MTNTETETTAPLSPTQITEQLQARAKVLEQQIARCQKQRDTANAEIRDARAELAQITRMVNAAAGRKRS